jgi:hypothetical protein
MAVLHRVLLSAAFLAAPVIRARGQEPAAPDAEVTAATQPDTPAAEPGSESAQTARIVEGRPPLYSVKRALHPLTWLELAFKPGFRAAEGSGLQNLMNRKPDTDKVSGVRFGLGSMGTGSGFGPEVTFFHKNLLGRGIEVDVPLLYTYSRYQLYQFNASVPLPSDRFAEHLSLDLGTSYSSRARDNFFGIGNESPLGDEETRVRLVNRQAWAGFTAKVNDQWTAALRAVYRNVGVTKPTVGLSAQEQFASTSTPGLFGGIIRSAVFSVGHNSVVRDDYAFKGGLDQFEFSFNRGSGGGGFNFEYWRYRLNSEHFFWLTSDGRKVIAARGLLETNLTPAGRTVPFFDMPALGSDDTLRGFQNLRFRDKSALAATLEYRYRIWPALDWGLFIDEGQVAPQLGDLALNGFHTGYGVRLFVWPKPKLPIGLEYGRSRETWRLYLNFNANF